jgi:hypothetical protein
VRAAEQKTRYLLIGGAFLAAVVVLEFLSVPMNLFREKSAFLNFSLLLLGFGLLSFFLLKRTLANFTTWWSGMILLQFGVAPLLCDFLGISLIDSYSVQALVYVFLGTACFWAGARVMDRNPEEPSFSSDMLKPGDRRTYAALIMLALGCAAKVYMIKAGLFMYGSDVNQVEAALQYREYLTIFSGLTLFAQIILSVEFFCKPNKLVRFGFLATTAANIGFALVSGMKGEIIVIPFLILLIRKLATGKFEARLALGLVALLLVLFPLNAAYRSEVHNEGSITSVETGKNAIGRAVGTVSEGSQMDFLESAVESAANRMNLLPVIVFLDQEKEIGGSSSIEGDERIWMIPYYPFVPRYLWKDKPILDKGRRLSLAMGSTESSSTAVTPFGDLLVTGGLWAMLVGMAGVGVVIQFITNLVSRNFSPKALFIYCVIFSKFYAPEMDVTMFGTSLIQTAVVALVAAYFVYGEKLFHLAPKQPSMPRSRVTMRLAAVRHGQMLPSRARR